MILIGNGKLITRDPDAPYYENGAVVIQGSTITDIGDFTSLREKYKEAQFIDAHGSIIMPGMINMHMHIYAAIWLGLSIEGNHPKNFSESIKGTWWTADRRMSLEGLRACVYAAFLDSIRNGVTTVFCHHASFAAQPGSLFALKEVADEMGLRICLCYEVSERDGLRKCRESIAENAELVSVVKKNNDDMTSSMFGVHTLSSVSDTTLKCLKEANDGTAGYHIHFSKEMDEVRNSLNCYGCRPVERLMYSGILGSRTTLANHFHMNHIEEDIVRDTGTMMVNNPESDVDSAASVTSILKMLQNDIPVGMGSDTYTHDMLENLKTFEVLQRRGSNGRNLEAGRGIKMLLGNNGRMASRFFSKPLGIISPGAAADVVVMDYKPYTPFSEENSDSHLLFGMNGRCCRTTIINGKLIYHDGKYTAFDEDEIQKKILTQSRKLWVRLKGRDYL